MHIANLADRLVVLIEGNSIDVETASNGRFSADPQAIYAQWPEFIEWASSADLSGGTPYDQTQLGSPAPFPRQVLAVGLNYRAHAAESGQPIPELPMIFTKFPTCIAGPYLDVTLPAGGATDWEAELVAIIGREAHNVTEASAWDYVAGLSVGQDISERNLQLADLGAPQFSMGKSYPGFGPIGPWLVTPDEFANPDDLAMDCSIDGVQMQKTRTGDMIFSVPQLVAHLSSVITLLPGDVIFTGTPSGVGRGQNPQRFLAAGENLTTRIEGIGEIRQHFVSADAGR